MTKTTRAKYKVRRLGVENEKNTRVKYKVLPKSAQNGWVEDANVVKSQVLACFE